MNKPILVEDLGMIYPTEKSKAKKHYGIYVCKCGTEFKAIMPDIKSGNTKSCGCYKKENTARVNSTHGMSNILIYRVWRNMRARCYYKNSVGYKNYGGKGIEVCDRWNSNFENFYEDMKDGYLKELSIDRIDNNGNYEPNNCRWVKKEVQMRNTRLIRKTNKSGYRGILETKSKKFAAKICVNRKTYIWVLF